MTQSMEEVINPGDIVITAKINWFIGSSLYDIVAFQKKNDKTIFIKRIIASPQDTISIDRDFLRIREFVIPHDPIFEMMVEESDHPDSTSYFSARTYSEYLLSKSVSSNNIDKYIIENGNALIVPNDYYFMVGDNYYESMDSRFWGFIPKENIKGKVVFIF